MPPSAASRLAPIARSGAASLGINRHQEGLWSGSCNPGNADDSNLVKALRGEAPFGLDIGTPGATIARMPARMNPMAPEDITCIVNWINEGCPE